MVAEAMMSGHCRFPQTANPNASHERCQRNGGGNTARPSKEFAPCPCPCHYANHEQYECGECEGVLIETDWVNDDPSDIDEDGNLYPVYVHLDPETGALIGQECP